MKQWKIEAKITNSKRIAVHEAWLDKIYNEAIREGKNPALCISFGGRKKPDWVIIRFDDWVM